MKKILAIMTTLVMMICLAVPVMAEEEETPSVSSDDLVIEISESDETPSEADMEGYELIGKVLDATLVHSESGEEATEEEVAAYIKAQGGSIVVDFSEYVKETPDKVLHKVGSWKSESFSGTKVTVSSLSPFAFLKKTVGRSGRRDGCRSWLLRSKSPQECCISNTQYTHGYPAFVGYPFTNLKESKGIPL